MQTPEQVAINLRGIKKVAEKFLDFTPGKPNSALIIDNNEFYTDMSFLRFLREVGKHFTVNHMVAKDSVRSRMEDREHGISYTEFSYMLLQAYDFYSLHQKFGCSLQIGASDQWGNITAGTELIRRKLAHDTHPASHSSEKLLASEKHATVEKTVEKTLEKTAEKTAEKNKEALPPAFGLTHPLITRSDGTKFGKSEKGAVWLTEDKTSPYQFYQFFIQSPDDVVMSLIRYLTFLPQAEIDALEEKLKTEPEKKAAQLTIARELTKIVHGEATLARVEKATQALFGTEIKELDLQTLNEIFADTPSTTKTFAELEAGIPLLDLLAEVGLFQSKGAARKEVPAGGVYLNNERVTDIAFLVRKDQLIANAAFVLRKGKKNYHVVKIVT